MLNNEVMAHHNWMVKYANRLSNRYGTEFDDVYQELALELCVCRTANIALLRVASRVASEDHPGPAGSLTYVESDIGVSMAEILDDFHEKDHKVVNSLLCGQTVVDTMEATGASRRHVQRIRKELWNCDTTNRSQ